MRRADVLCKCKEYTFNGMALSDCHDCPRCGARVYLVSFNPPAARANDRIFPDSKLHPRVLRVYESQA